jgi:hypothetical protein
MLDLLRGALSKPLRRLARSASILSAVTVLAVSVCPSRSFAQFADPTDTLYFSYLGTEELYDAEAAIRR